MRIADFDWLLDYPIWASEPPHAIFDLCPRGVIQDQYRHPVHQRKIENADTSFPLHVMHWKERWVIVDGFHRLAKLMRQGHAEVQVYKVPVAAIPLLALNE